MARWITHPAKTRFTPRCDGQSFLWHWPLSPGGSSTRRLRLRSRATDRTHPNLLAGLDDAIARARRSLKFAPPPLHRIDPEQRDLPATIRARSGCPFGESAFDAAIDVCWRTESVNGLEKPRRSPMPCCRSVARLNPERGRGPGFEDFSVPEEAYARSIATSPPTKACIVATQHLPPTSCGTTPDRFMDHFGLP